MKTAGRPKAKLFTAVVAIVAAAGAGCVYTWRPYWWNFYDRGLSRASQGKLQEAAEAFETATGKRTGATVSRPKDARHVRTYGMHFIDDYFPHRELGVAYYRMNRFADAERELLISLDQTPSAKAKLYLNLARGALLRQKPAQDQPPSLTLNVADEPYINSDSIRLTGVAKSKNYVSSIFINGQRLFVELARQELEFSRELRLKPGQNRVLVEAVDLVGKSSQKKLLLNVDMEYPAVAIEDVVRKGPDTVAVSGLVTDNVGISELTIGGRRQAIEPFSTEVDFSLDTPLPHTIVLKVADLAGNTTSARVSISADMLQPAGGGSYRPVLLAMCGSGRVVDCGGTGIILTQAATGGDGTPPVISLPNVADGRIIYDDEFIFDGVVHDNGRLAALSVNGEDILGRRTGVLAKYFTYRAKLAEGVNRFTVVAVDRAGNRAEKGFRIIRKIQQPLQQKARLTLALLPLQQKGSRATATSQIYGVLLGSFYNCGRFNMVERQPEFFAALLTELKIASSKLADPATAVRIGRIVNADGILCGKTIEDERSITVDLWLVDTETSEILFFADVYAEDKNPDELRWLLDGLVLKFRQHFPLVRGRVVRVADTGVFIDNGSLNGIWAGMKYLILKENREGDSGALTALAVNGKNLEARVRTVEPQSCFAGLSDKNGARLVNVNDPVITK